MTLLIYSQISMVQPLDEYISYFRYGYLSMLEFNFILLKWAPGFHPRGYYPVAAFTNMV